MLFIMQESGIFFLFQICGSPNSESVLPEVPDEPTCTDRYGSLVPPHFNLRACAMCYAFLFPHGKPLQPLHPRYVQLGYITPNETRIYDPDIDNSTATDQICDTLNDDECERWRACCVTAAECCKRHVRMPQSPRGSTFCARTWDGYSCWDDTTPGTTVSAPCPNFIDHSITTSKTSHYH